MNAAGTFTLKEALKWADNFGPIQSDPPSGDGPALVALAKEVRRLESALASERKEHEEERERLRRGFEAIQAHFGFMALALRIATSGTSGQKNALIVSNNANKAVGDYLALFAAPAAQCCGGRWVYVHSTVCSKPGPHFDAKGRVHDHEYRDGVLQDDEPQKGGGEK
jgi:hypothetical protein